MKEIHDKYFRLAKREGKLARSYYKLQEIHRRVKLLKPGQRVLDIGACPGSWLEFILENIGKKGVACAVDLNVIARKFKGIVDFKKIDVRELDENSFADSAKQFDVVVSDMAPKTSGIKLTDQARSLELCEIAAEYAFKVLAPKGAFVCKIFESPEVKPFRERLHPNFQYTRMIKPDASRDESMETYIVCMGYGQEPEAKRERPDHEYRKTKGKRTRQY